MKRNIEKKYFRAGKHKEDAVILVPLVMVSISGFSGKKGKRTENNSGLEKSQIIFFLTTDLYSFMQKKL